MNSEVNNIELQLPPFIEWLFVDFKTLKSTEQIRRLFFFYLAVLMVAGALVWGLICLFFSLGQASLVPFGFIGFTALNLAICRKSPYHDLHCNAQVVVSISLPFLFQYMLGGIAASGAVMLWSVVALLGAMTFQGTKRTIIWFVVLGLLMGLSCWYEQYLDSSLSPMLLALNAIAVTAILFFISGHFVDKQIDLRRKVVSRTDVLKEKNTEINNSLESAKNIQENILPSIEAMGAGLADLFVFYRPRDVVSGDFYWTGQYMGRTYIACADCTGHGVPGAFMSMMGQSLIDQIFYKDGITAPAAMLEALNKAIITALKQETSGNHDGMDISIIAYDPSSRQVEFAGAKSRMIFIDPKGALTTIKGTKSSVGGMQHSLRQDFTSTQFEVTKGSKLFMLTDGIVDQFGGPNDKRLMTKRFNQWVSDNATHSMARMRRRLEIFYADWAMHTEQTDDILVIGLEF